MHLSPAADPASDGSEEFHTRAAGCPWWRMGTTKEQPRTITAVIAACGATPRIYCEQASYTFFTLLSLPIVLFSESEASKNILLFEEVSEDSLIFVNIYICLIYFIDFFAKVLIFYLLY